MPVCQEGVTPGDRVGRERERERERERTREEKKVCLRLRLAMRLAHVQFQARISHRSLQTLQTFTFSRSSDHAGSIVS
jgi:predicted transposase YdaD